VEDGLNIAFREIGIKKIGGANQVVVLPAGQGKPLDMEQGFTAGKARIFIGTVEGIQMAELIGSSWSSSTVYTWPNPSQFADVETWGTWVVGSNGISKLAVWKNTGLGEELAGTDFLFAQGHQA
jgi:hypothetical protein